jgi:hypothetical protein
MIRQGKRKTPPMQNIAHVTSLSNLWLSFVAERHFVQCWKSVMAISLKPYLAVNKPLVDEENSKAWISVYRSSPAPLAMQLLYKNGF